MDSAQADSGIVAASCLCAVHDPVSRRCPLTRAGHPLPAVLAPDGTVEFLAVLDALSFTVELIVSELVTNAVRHAGGPYGYGYGYGCAAPAPRTRAAAGSSRSPGSSSAGGPATPRTERSSGPNSPCREGTSRVQSSVSGNDTVNTVEPGSLLSSIVPPCARTSELATARPSPLPPRSRLRALSTR